MTTPLRQTAWQKRLPTLLSFFLPMLIASICFACLPIFPFGQRQLLSSDGWHQYYPFLLVFRDKLLNGGSLQYTWHFGAGMGFTSLFAYYLASPIYLLSALVPLSMMREFFAFATILKIGMAGLFFCIFLRTVYRKNNLTLIFFALMYALCAWSAGYYWNIMWLDVFALLPLLVAGTVALLRDGHFRLYVVALTLSLWCNYYIAFFCCIFVVFCFIGFCLVKWNGFGNLLRRFARIGLCTLLGVGIAAMLWVPTILAMQNTYSSVAKEVEPLSLNIAESANGITVSGQSLWSVLKEETLPGAWDATRQIFSTLLTGQTPTWYGGMPNLFCSFTAVLLAVYLFCCKKIKLREKLFYAFLLLFFLVSLISRKLDYLWHGMHIPNCLPYRYSFLMSFVLIAMAYRAFTQFDGLKKRHCFIILGVGALLLANAFLPDLSKTLSMLWQLLKKADFLTLLQSPAPRMLLFATLVWVAVGVSLFLYRPSGKRKIVSISLLCFVIVFEMSMDFALGANEIGATDRDSYLWEYQSVRALENYADEHSDELFYRSENTGTYTLNEGALYGFNGVSVFSSSANANFCRFARSLGLCAYPAANTYSYFEATPFANTMLGVKYLYDRLNQHRNTDYNTEVANSGGTKLLQSKAYIGLGFMADSALSDFVSDKGNRIYIDPMRDQQKLFALATGIDDPLYTALKHTDLEADDGTDFYVSGDRFYYTTQDGRQETKLRCVYTVTSGGLYCVSVCCYGAKEVSVTQNGTRLFSRKANVPSLFSIGNCSAGDELVFEFNITNSSGGSVYCNVAQQNNDVFDRGLAKLADEPFVLTAFSDTALAGTVTAKQDGLFYTSIPYEPGWTAYVDGKQVALAKHFDASAEAVRLTDAVICFPLSAGTHEIRLQYRTPGLTLGAVISVISLVLFLALVFFLRKRPVLLPDKPRVMDIAAAELPEEESLPEADADVLPADAVKLSDMSAPPDEAAPTDGIAPSEEDVTSVETTDIG